MKKKISIMVSLILSGSISMAQDSIEEPSVNVLNSSSVGVYRYDGSLKNHELSNDVPTQFDCTDYHMLAEDKFTKNLLDSSKEHLISTFNEIATEHGVDPSSFTIEVSDQMGESNYDGDRFQWRSSRQFILRASSDPGDKKSPAILSSNRMPFLQTQSEFSLDGGIGCEMKPLTDIHGSNLQASIFLAKVRQLFKEKATKRISLGISPKSKAVKELIEQARDNMLEERGALHLSSINRNSKSKATKTPATTLNETNRRLK